MNKESLRQFLVETKNHGYANEGGSKNWVKEKDGSTTIVFEFGDFRMHDNFFGGEPYGGREVIFFKGVPVWMMVYYGSVDPAVQDPKEIYRFLQKALLNLPEGLPLRGPKIFQDGDFVYENKNQGDLDNYSGEEKISKAGKEIYRANYMGGLVNQRKE